MVRQFQGRSADRCLIGGGVVVDLVGDVHAHGWSAAGPAPVPPSRPEQPSPSANAMTGLAREQPVSGQPTAKLLSSHASNSVLDGRWVSVRRPAVPDVPSAGRTGPAATAGGSTARRDGAQGCRDRLPGPDTQGFAVGEVSRVHVSISVLTVSLVASPVSRRRASALAAVATTRSESCRTMIPRSVGFAG